jgi:hypothetical protein
VSRKQASGDEISGHLAHAFPHTRPSALSLSPLSTNHHREPSSANPTIWHAGRAPRWRHEAAEVVLRRRRPGQRQAEVLRPRRPAAVPAAAAAPPRGLRQRRARPPEGLRRRRQVPRPPLPGALLVAARVWRRRGPRGDAPLRELLRVPTGGVPR